ncbi:MAG TPA: hypothetical protein VEF76_12370 [Patescibacteria group bacterium]|nr:hypothetical protein [Patescibacteria group bacterium]
MSINRFDYEPRRIHFRRFLSRLYKQWKNIPLTVEDMSVIRVTSAGGTIYEARRGHTGAWTVYRISRHSYEGIRGDGRSVWETLRQDVPVETAVAELIRRCPPCLTSDETRYNHPANVLKLLNAAALPT